MWEYFHVKLDVSYPVLLFCAGWPTTCEARGSTRTNTAIVKYPGTLQAIFFQSERKSVSVIVFPPDHGTLRAPCSPPFARLVKRSFEMGGWVTYLITSVVHVASDFLSRLR